MRKFFVVISCLVGMIMLIGCGNNYESAFEKFINELDRQDGDGASQKIHYEYGYIDEDDIPELFVVRGGAHSDSVEVYKYISGEDKVIHVGTFGEFGQCEYIPKENILIASYGGSGYFLNTYSRIKADGGVEMVDYILSDGSTAKVIYYYGFPIGDFSGSVSGDSHLSEAMNRPSDDYIITESVANAIYEKYHNNTQEVSYE